MSKDNKVELSINQITFDQNRVTKRYFGPGAMHRWQTEKYVLSFGKGQLPVPPLIDNENEAEILMEKISGTCVENIIDINNSQEIFQTIGQTLKKIHEFPAIKMKDSIPGNGLSLIHGDFSILNLFLDQSSKPEITILDWEWAHLGEPVEDLAWMEWSIRMNYGKFIKELPFFFEAYGEIPDWQYRKEAMTAQCFRNLEFARMVGERKLIQQWQMRTQITKRMQPF